MANTNGTNPYSPGEPRCSERKWKHAHETGGARKPRKKAVPKGQCKDPLELLNYLNALSSPARTRKRSAAIVLLPSSTIKQRLVTLPPTWTLRVSSSARIRNCSVKVPLKQACQHWSHLHKSIWLLRLINATPSGAACKPVFPTSLFEYSDDDFDHLLDNKELDEDAKRIEYANLRKRDTIGRRKGALLEGGPQEPSYEGMTAGKERVAREEYQYKRKKWRDQTRSKRLRAKKTTDFNDNDYTGNLSPTLRTMSDVCTAHFERGHSFPDWDLVLLCVSKEANFPGFHYTVKKSNNWQLYCTGPGFLIYALHSVTTGWLVTRCEFYDTESAGNILGVCVDITSVNELWVHNYHHQPG